MATAPVIEIDALLAPIPGDNPAGERASFMLKSKLDGLRVDINPDDYAADDPQRPEQAKPAEWDKIIAEVTRALRDESKDLVLVARLIEALVKEHGFAGFRDGLQLLRRLLGECWDRILPVVEEPDDVEYRAGPINWLDSSDSGGLFPITLRNTPVVIADRKFSWQDFRLMQEKKGVSEAEFDAACRKMPLEKIQTLKEDLDEAVAELEQLYNICGEKMGQFAPGLTDIRSATKDIHTLVKQILAKVGGGSGGAADAASGKTEETGGGVGSGAIGAGATRDQIYRQLRAAAQQLRMLEPHSPVPYLVDRAVEMGDMPFPLMIRALIRDAGVLNELDREIGIKRADAAEAPPSE